MIVDKGYFAYNLYKYLLQRNDLDSRELKYFKDRALSRHESYNRLTKNFRCMLLPFRHDHGRNDEALDQFPRHKDCMEAICVTIQFELDMGIKSLLVAVPVDV